MALWYRGAGKLSHETHEIKNLLFREEHDLSLNNITITVVTRSVKRFPVPIIDVHSGFIAVYVDALVIRDQHCVYLRYLIWSQFSRIWRWKPNGKPGAVKTQMTGTWNRARMQTNTSSILGRMIQCQNAKIKHLNS
ncbi:JM105 [macacine gammaherpesvirus 11]|uniref:JM105 n=2 Tax=macacine gammaherpesvirus 11 TaxID=2560570 RepID=G9JMT3_9GAMA|nr:JM105 [Macaca fuscata rhadinovirus]AAT00082.1 JM105 [Macaca fuscata rhadinovirus]AEW87630.1 JM105 [Macaca fuscata rhadinovirus]AEW87800.1 JM105 [Macaca fuscata rhadinovirus]